MSLLAERWPEAISFQELVNETEARISKALTVPRADLVNALATNLAHSFIRQVVELYVSPPKVRTVAGEFPRASALARLQATNQPHITTQLHASASLNDFARKIVLLADGSRSRGDILSALRQAVQNRELVLVDEAGQPQATHPVDQVLESALDKSLSELARMGFWC
jgi:methyltransferase-like protein